MTKYFSPAWLLANEQRYPNHARGTFISDRLMMINRKSQIDALFLELPGVSAGKINDLDAYFIGGKMFACINGDGVALRLPVDVATDLQFSRENVVPFQARSIASSRERVQINRTDSAEYAKDINLFKTSIDFVRSSRIR